MNAKQIRAIHDEYDRLEGTVTGEIVTTLWDHGSNHRRIAHCIVIDLGRRPPVPPAVLTREDRQLMALRGTTHRITPVRNTQPVETLAKRLHEWLKGVGAATHMDAAKACNVTDFQAKHLLTSNAHLFKFWKKIAGQSFYIAI